MIEIVENTKDLPETLAAEGEVRLALCCAVLCGAGWQPVGAMCWRAWQATVGAAVVAPSCASLPSWFLPWQLLF